MVPHEATVLMAARTERPVPVAESRAIGGSPGQVVQLAQAAATSNRVKVTYKVQQGDTLASIARNFKTSVASIRTWNPSVTPDRITPGERLTIFTRAN
jgi:LysM repeat protein